MELYAGIVKSFWDVNRRELIGRIRYARRTVIIETQKVEKPIKVPKAPTEKKSVRRKKTKLTPVKEALAQLLLESGITLNDLLQEGSKGNGS